MDRAGLPPSPPLEDDARLGGTAFASDSHRPDSPPHSPKPSAAHPHPPSSHTTDILCSSPETHTAAAAGAECALPPLSSELFFTVLSFVPQRARPRLGLVSRGWYNYLINEPRLWPQLDINLAADQASHIRTWVNRARQLPEAGSGGIKSVNMWMPMRRSRANVYDDTVAELELGRRVSLLVGSLQNAHDGAVAAAGKGAGPTGVRALDVHSQPSTLLTIKLFDSVMRASQLSCFRNLRMLNLVGWVANPRLSALFLSTWPELERSRLLFHSTACPGINDGTSVEFRLGLSKGSFAPVRTLDWLREIDWAGVVIPRAIRLPYLPALTKLTLVNVEWEGCSLQYLVRLARRTLEEIVISDLTVVNLDGDDGYQDWQTFVNVTDPHEIDGWTPPSEQSRASQSARSDPNSDEDRFDVLDPPAPIVLPALRSLTLTGKDTPPLFACAGEWDDFDQEGVLPGPVWYMANLVEAKLELDWVEPSEALTTFASTTPKLERLALTGPSVTVLELFKLLALRGSDLRSLSVAESNMNDILLARLPELTPVLEHLDVRWCTDVSAGAVARVVEAIRDRSAGNHRLGRVEVDCPEWGNSEARAWEWLLFHGVLVRDEDDFEGLGPREGDSKRRWVSRGKRDSDLDTRRAREKQLIDERERDESRRRERAELVALIHRSRAEVARGEGPESAEVNYGPVMPWPSAIQQLDRPSQPKPAQRRKVSAREEQQASFEQRVRAIHHLEPNFATPFPMPVDPRAPLERRRSSTPVIDINLDDDPVEKPSAGRKRSSSSVSEDDEQPTSLASEPMSLSPDEER